MESPKTFAVQFKGLEPSEASRRLKTFGPNRLTPPSLSRGFLGVLRTLADPMSLMLLLASAVYFFMGDSRNGLILAVAVAPVLLVDVLLEARSKNALKKLAQAVAPNSRVIRGGQEIEIPTEELVPGDLLLLREGDSAHSDGIILQAAHLGMDESSLTGESDLKLKEPLTVVPGVKGDESNQFYAGSIARSGHGLGQVTVTGSRTRFGQIAILASEEKPHQTPLQKKIGRLVKLLVVGSIFAVAGIFGLVFWRTGDLERSFLSGVSLAISAIPEEFPLVFTLFLSLGAWRLSLKGVLIRRLSSVETLGSTTVLCVDKTGTLTEGEFHLESHQSLDGTLSELEILEASVLACELSPADPMEKAVWRHAVEHGLDVSTLEKKWQLVFDYDFDPAGKHMSHVWKKEKEGKTEWRIVAKGALEGVLEHCAVTLEERKTIEEANRLLAAQGMRILVLAGRWATSFIGDRLQDERDLKIYGLLGFKDPLRSDVPEAVAQCQKAGIKIKLLTGDHLLTAHAVADTAGVAHESDGILNGPELFQLPKASFEEKVRKGSIFGRVQPEQKYAIVEALQKAGEIVAMTGDGVNDAPALRKADIGISMGKKATEVARASADLVLLEDDLSGIISTMREGRHIFANLQRATSYLAAYKPSLILIALFCPLTGLPMMLLPVHLVLLEMIQHPLTALAFEGDQAPGVMDLPPRPASAPLLSQSQVVRSLISGFILAAGVLFFYALRLNHSLPYARSAGLAVFMVGNLFLVWASRADDKPWNSSFLFNNSRFWLVAGLTALSFPIFLEIPALASLLQAERLAPIDWLWAFLISFASVGWRVFGFFSRKQTQKEKAAAS